MQKYVLLSLAGAAGVLARYWATEALARRYGEAFPWGTLAVNLTGCFLAGLLFQLLQERVLLGDAWRAALLVGLLGAFTTFSSYGLQTFALLREGAFGRAAVYVVASNLAGLLTVWAGYALAKLLPGGR